MAMQEYRIREFLGIDQSTEEGGIEPGASPDACNMDTDDGSLAVAKGYVKFLLRKVPGEKPIRRLFAWQGLISARLIAVAGNELYACTITEGEPEWALIYSYPAHVKNLRVDGMVSEINSADHFLIACGEHSMIKWNGVDAAAAFGSEAKLSNKNVNYIAKHYGRLFSAGDPDKPSRLYWSKTPGDNRTIEDWGVEQASENASGGHVEVGDTSGDPITGLRALSNQLLIFKRNSIYRLLGDRPSNFRVYRVYAEVEQMQNSACICYGDVPYWMTSGGLYYFDGQTALRSRTAKRISGFLRGADFSNCRAAKFGTKLYFTAYERERDKSNAGALRNADNALVLYDLERQTYMLRRGFGVADICMYNNKLLMVNDARYIYKLEEGEDYDGAPIEAYWNTPMTDLQQKQGVKTLHELYIRGLGESGSDIFMLDARIGRNTRNYRYLMPEHVSDVLEIPLKNEGRTFAFKLFNEHGSRWRIAGGMQVLFDHRMRTM